MTGKINYLFGVGIWSMFSIPFNRQRVLVHFTLCVCVLQAVKFCVGML